MEATKPMATWKLVLLWILTAFLTVIFLTAGGTKLAGFPVQADNFARWGYPGWFMYVVGVVEAGGAIALLIPRVAGFAALLLCGTMVGAALTHLVHGEMTAAPVPLVLLALVALVGYARRDPVLALVGRFKQS
ncbi:MAG: DoxX family protein [Nitrospirota bacterium]